MISKPLNILAINPGSRYLGIAVFLGTDLRDWGIRVMKGKNVRDCVMSYVNQYGINVIAIKKLHVNRSSKVLRRMVDEITNLAEKQKIIICEYSIDELKKKILSEEGGNKQRLMEEVSVKYPFLISGIPKESRKGNPYLVRMFEAIALGIVCFNQLDIGNRKVVKSEK